MCVWLLCVVFVVVVVVVLGEGEGGRLYVKGLTFAEI